MLELGYWDRKRIHNLKYFTWVEQQGKTVEELDAQWYDDDYWTAHFHAWEEWDRQIDEFNERTGLLERSIADQPSPVVLRRRLSFDRSRTIAWMNRSPWTKGVPIGHQP